MMTFTVHEPEGRPADVIERAESLVFVRDGFSFAAALLTPFWLLANRLWLALLIYVVAMSALQGLVAWAGVSANAAGWLILALHVVVGFEADSIKRWTLRRRGFSMIGSVSGRSVDTCERRFFDAWLKGQPFVIADDRDDNRTNLGRGWRGVLGFGGRRG